MLKGVVSALLRVVLLSQIVFFAQIVLFSQSTFGHGEGEGKVELSRPPASLDKYYPPHSKNFEFLGKMYLMSRSFSAVFLYLERGDRKKAEKWARKLVENYIGIKRMVPEWSEYIKEDVARAFLDAVRKGDTKRVSELSRKLGDTCSSCHKKHMLSVKVFYHTPDWHKVRVEDPVTLRKVGIHKLMKRMTNSMKMMTIGVEDGDFDFALRNAKEFVARAKAVKETCSSCHTDKASVEALAGKKYILSLDALQRAIRNKNADEFFKNLRTVSSYCTRCHNTHQTLWSLKSALE